MQLTFLQQMLLFIFFGVEAVLGLDRAFNGSKKIWRKALWFAFGGGGLVGMTSMYASSL